MKALVAAVAATLLLTGCGASKTSIESAVDDCNMKTHAASAADVGSWASVIDGGKSLSIRIASSGGMEFTKDSYSCVLGKLGTGLALAQRMAMTRPTDPAGNFSWDHEQIHHYQATWTAEGTGQQTTGFALVITER